MMLFASCVSGTLITAEPKNSKIYIDNEYVGNGSYEMYDAKVVGSCTPVKIESEGYKTLNTLICRNERVDAGAIIGGLFLVFPFLWSMGYLPEHRYTLEKINANENASEIEVPKTKKEKLLELNELLEEGLIKQEDYEKAKQEILAK